MNFITARSASALAVLSLLLFPLVTFSDARAEEKDGVILPPARASYRVDSFV